MSVLRLKVFDCNNQLEMVSEMQAAVSREKPTNLIIDLTLLPFGYAVLWNQLICLRKELAAREGKLALCLTGDVLMACRALGLETIFNVHSSIEDALRDFID